LLTCSKYSERPGTKAAKKLKDDVPEEVKSRRLTEIIELQNKLSQTAKTKDLNRVYEVLVEGTSKNQRMTCMEEPLRIK